MTVGTGAELQPSIPEQAWDVAFGSPGDRLFDVFPDGRSLVAIKRDDRDTGNRLHVVLDWFQDLEQLLPAR